MKFKNLKKHYERSNRFAVSSAMLLTALFFAAFLVVASSQSKAQPDDVAVSLNLEVKVAFEGLFDVRAKAHKRDCTAEIILRDPIDPGLIHGIKSTTFDGSKMIASAEFDGLYPGEYYIGVKREGSIEIVSSEPVFLESSTSNFMDFTDSKEKAYASNLLEVDLGTETIALVYAGDVNDDDIVDGTDYSLVENDALNYLSGNVITDLSCDNFVDGDDLLIVELNSRNFVQAYFPPGSVFLAGEIEPGKAVTEIRNYPNPFNPATTVAFDLQSASDVRLSVFDMTGREVAVLVDSRLAPGSHSYNWNASQFASGTYFLRMSLEGKQYVRQMQLIK